MKSFALLALTVCVLAQSDLCPNGSSPDQAGGMSFCCPSNSISSDSTGTYCVLGCQMGYEPCYPYCTDPGTSNDLTTSGTCTSVPITASDYSQRVGLATANSAATTSSANTQTATMSASVQTVTMSGSTQTITTSVPGATQTGSTSSSSTATSTTSSSSRNAGAMVTAAPLLIFGAIAGAMAV